VGAAVVPPAACVAVGAVVVPRVVVPADAVADINPF
jgi:hypothetical protein